jgi:hypothetical protein
MLEKRLDMDQKGFSLFEIIDSLNHSGLSRRFAIAKKTPFIFVVQKSIVVKADWKH